MPRSRATAVGIVSTAAGWVVAVSAGAALFLSAATSHAAEPCEPGIARIVSLQGRVEVQRGEAGAWTAAALDEQLCIGDTIRVGALARAALALANDSVLSIDQLTTLRLDAPAEPGHSLLDLLSGAVHFFSHRPRTLEIDTPIASAGAEGTEFLMRVRPDRTEVVMFEGRVRLRTPEGELLLASGDAGIATPGAAPRPEIVARPRDAVAWALYYPPILAPLAERRPAPSALPQGLQTAIERVAANDYAGAIAALDAVPEPARDARYYTYRAGVLLNVGRVDEASQAIDRALALNPDAAEALAERAVIAVVQNRRADALADARRAVELDPASAPARIALSYALQASFDLEAARATLREAAAHTPDNALVQARLAELELSFGNLDAAEAAAERAVALAPELERTQMVLGFAALTRIDIDQARAAFERAIALDSAEPLARLGLGLAKIRAGHLDAGGRELEIAVALDPNDSLLRSYLGKAYFEEKRGPQDADQFRIAKELDPNDPTPWFYDAIRLQTENRPVEALHNLEKSIALNDNRAPYRSRLLLDEDVAVRQTSLARIYSDLGFNQVALVEATKSLNQDPTNYSAHRFLSDTYALLPRHEIARASEQLQSQLFQPININPVPPSAPITDLNVITAARPTEAAFNEFTPLFERNRAQLTAAGTAGSNQTYGNELIASGLWNRYSLSAGQFHFQTDGFRKNNDLQNNIYTLFGQSDLTEKLSVQAEYRHRRTDSGDRQLRFNLDDFRPNFRDDIEEDVFRVGGRITPAPGQVGLISGIYTDRQDDTKDEDVDFGSKTKDKLSTNISQLEAQYLGEFGSLRLVGGAGGVGSDGRTRESEDGEPFPKRQHNITAGDIYLTANLALSPALDLTTRLGYADVSIESKQEGGQDEIGTAGLTPGFGFIWRPAELLQLRAAGGRTIKRPYVANQTLEPTQLAGFNELLDDKDGTRADWLGLGADLRASESLRIGSELVWRRLSRQVSEPTDTGDFQHKNETARDDRATAYLYWIATDQIVMSLELIGEDYSANKRDNPSFSRMRTLTVPLRLNYTMPAGWFATAQTSFVAQDVDQPSDGDNTDLDSHGLLVDLAAGYRLPKRYGIIAVEATNLLDERLAFQDESFRTSRGQVDPRFIPSRAFFATVTLNF